MYDVLYQEQNGGPELIFVSDVPGHALAERIARNLADEFGESVHKAWAERQ